jgi:hypothetical protein
MEIDLKGQWIGRYAGTNMGLLVIELDDMGTHYEGHACAYDDDQTLPSTFVTIKTTNKDPSFRQRLELLPLNPHTGEPTSWKEIGGLYTSNVVSPNSADVTLQSADDTLNISWTTNIGTSGYAEIKRTKADALTEYQPIKEVTSWEEFKKYVNSLDYRRYIFRGQTKPHRLRTSFHRTGRASLPRFLNEDIRTLHRHLSLKTTHVFNLTNPDENGAFFNLAQHHGYPTPLLDWTFSPFVAAFFAYSRLKNSIARRDDAGKVRIFMFDQKVWKETQLPMNKLAWCRPYFSITEFIPIDNPRMVPQQSISTVTNVDDIETYIRSLEHPKGQFLKIIDLPVNERPKVMRELSIMGITAGSLFPGLDGACEELKERFFDL